jgi:hypothetical protein
MPLLSQEPGRPKEDDPQQSIFGHGYDPYGGLCKQESHADGVADRSRDEYEDDPGRNGHDIYNLIKQPPK